MLHCIAQQQVTATIRKNLHRAAECLFSGPRDLGAVEIFGLYSISSHDRISKSSRPLRVSKAAKFAPHGHVTVASSTAADPVLSVEEYHFTLAIAAGTPIAFSR